MLIKKTLWPLLKDEYINTGYCIVRGVLDDDFLNFIETEINLICSNPCDFNLDSKQIHYTDSSKTVISSLHNLIDILPDYRSWMNHTPVDELISFIFGEPLDAWLYNSSYFAKPEFCGLLTTPHQDNGFFNMISCASSPVPKLATCWFGLDNSDKENGGLYYYKASHELGDLPHYPIGSKGASMAIRGEDSHFYESYEKVYVSLNRGDLIIHNPLVVHGSDANISSRSRRGLNFSKKAISCERNNKKWNRYLALLDQYLKNNNPIGES